MREKKQFKQTEPSFACETGSEWACIDFPLCCIQTHSCQVRINSIKCCKQINISFKYEKKHGLKFVWNVFAIAVAVLNNKFYIFCMYICVKLHRE